MMIVDAQIHLWAKGKPSAHHRQTPFLKDEALAAMDAAGVDRAVIHPVLWDPDSTGAQPAYRNLPQLLALARHPNVAVKATGQAGHALDWYPFRSIYDALHRVFDAFGPRRMFWGTDTTRMRCTWRECVTLFTEELPWLKGADLDWVMGRAFCDWIGWDTEITPKSE